VRLPALLHGGFEQFPFVQRAHLTCLLSSRAAKRVFQSQVALPSTTAFTYSLPRPISSSRILFDSTLTGPCA